MKYALIALLLLLSVPAMAQTPTPTPSPLSVGLHEAENNANITYTNNGFPVWTTVSDGANTYRQSNRAGASMAFTFTGRAVLIYRNLIWSLYRNEAYNGNTNSGSGHPVGNVAGSNHRRGQTFTPTRTGRFAGFNVTWAANVNTPTGTVTWQLQTTTGTPPYPSGVILNSGTFSAAPLSNTGTDPITNGAILQAGTTYALVLFATSTQTTGSRYQWAYSTTSPSGQINWQSTNGGATWSQTAPTNAAIFRVSIYSAPDVTACINAVCSTISNWSSTEQYRVPFGLVAPTQGTHSVTITQLNDNGESAFLIETPWQVDNVLVLDEQSAGGNTVIPFDVNLTIPEDPERITTEFSYQGTDYTGAMQLSITSGDVAIILLLLAICLVNIGWMIRAMLDKGEK